MPKPIFADAGSRSSFYIINSNRGFKTFSSYEAAEYAHNAQTILSQYDLAPRVYSDVKRRIVGGCKEWGFETEIAEMLGCGGNDCGCGECDDLYERYERRIANLCTRIDQKTGLEFVDGHIGNVGYVKRNGRRKLVCIDTGRESVGGHDSSYDYNSCSCTCCRG